MTMKRIIIGDASGNIEILNYFSGNLMKTLTPHENAEVTYLKCVSTSNGNVIISIAGDIIWFHQDNELSTSFVLWDIWIDPL